MIRSSVFRTFTRVAWALGVAAAPSSGVLAASAQAAAPAPALSVPTLAGDHFDLAAQRGKWVVINYWATWCSPCIKEMPALSAFVSAHRDVTAIGLAYEDQPLKNIRAFLRKHPVHYAVARVDPMHPPAGIAAPSVLPTTYLVAPDGHLAKTFIGPLDLDALGRIIAAGKAAP